jgi:predicted metal-dependent phosphoesterase TrpH
MSLKYDLHSHSIASDGTLSPTRLVERAAAAGVEVLALTDHDTLEGVGEAARAASRLGIRLIPGVELSVSWGPQVIHVVGLGVDPENGRLQAGLKELQGFREWRAEEIGRRLEKAGIPGGFAGAKARSSGRLIGRTHFARFLVDEGYEPNVRKVFKHYLVRGKPGYVPGQWATLDVAINWIRGAGGQAVIAHPARYPLTRGRLRRLLGEFVEAGGVGLEVVSGSHSRDDAFKMAAHARDFGLLASAGSDYHGPEDPWIELGRLPGLPEGCTPVWRDWERLLEACRT